MQQPSLRRVFPALNIDFHLTSGGFLFEEPPGQEVVMEIMRHDHHQ